MLSKRLIISASFLSVFMMGNLVSQVHAQDVIQNLQQKEDNFHNRVTQHNQAIRDRMQQNQERMDRYRDYQRDQRARWDQQRQDFKDRLNGPKREAQERMDRYRDYQRDQRARWDQQKQDFKDRLNEPRREMKYRQEQRRQEWKDLKNNTKQDIHDLTHPFSN